MIWCLVCLGLWWGIAKGGNLFCWECFLTSLMDFLRFGMDFESGLFWTIVILVLFFLSMRNYLVLDIFYEKK